MFDKIGQLTTISIPLFFAVTKDEAQASEQATKGNQICLSQNLQRPQCLSVLANNSPGLQSHDGWLIRPDETVHEARSESILNMYRSCASLVLRSSCHTGIRRRLAH